LLRRAVKMLHRLQFWNVHRDTAAVWALTINWRDRCTRLNLSTLPLCSAVPMWQAFSFMAISRQSALQVNLRLPLVVSAN